MTTDSLATHLNFTPDDLTANRAGQLSARQVARLRRMRRRTLLLAVGVVLVIVLAATAALFLGQQRASTILTFIGIGLTICGAAIAGAFLRNWLRLNADIDGGAVRSTTGPARHTIRVTGRAAVYLLDIDDQRFALPETTFLSFEEGRRYRIYWSPAARVLFTAEPA